MNYEPLHEARAKVAAARDALSAAAQAAQRAQKEAADELFKVREAERPMEAARDRRAYDAAAVAFESAKKDHALAIKRLTDCKDEQAHAVMQARALEAAVVGAVDQLLTDEIAERSKLVEYHLNEALRLGTALKYFAIAAGVHSTEVISPSTMGVLDRLNLPLINALDMPISVAQLGDTAAFREWTARRSALIDGDGEIAPKAA